MRVFFLDLEVLKLNQMNQTLRYLLWLWLSMSMLAAQAQYGARFSLKGHEIGLEPVALRQVPAYTDDYAGSVPVSVHLLRGLRYKFHLSMDDGLRLGVFQQQQRYQSGLGAEAKRQETQLQLGYERKVMRGYHMLFGGIDGLVNQGNLDGTAGANVAPIKTSYQSAGGMLFGGYRYFLSPYVSATLEVGAYYLRTRYDTPRSNLDLSGTFLYPEQEFGVSTSLYLSFHFGSIPKRCTCPKH
jgi:hypothetical protein